MKRERDRNFSKRTYSHLLCSQFDSSPNLSSKAGHKKAPTELDLQKEIEKRDKKKYGN